MDRDIVTEKPVNLQLPLLNWVTNDLDQRRLHKRYDSDRTGSPQRESISRVVSPSNDLASRVVNDGLPVEVSCPVPTSSDHLAGRPEKSTSNERARIVLRFRTKIVCDEKNSSGSDAVAAKTGDQNLSKVWNLRPRKVEFNKLVGNVRAEGGVSRISGAAQRVIRGKSIQTESTGSRAEPKKRKNTKFAIALWKTEIEADIIAMTGSKPSSKPRKRAKTLQKQLDFSFPGLWLVTPCS